MLAGGVLAATLALGVGVWWYGMVPPLEQCASKSTAQERDQCRLGVIEQQGLEHEALKSAIGTIEEPASRDMIRLSLIAKDPAHARVLCPEVEGEKSKSMCTRILERPHLSVEAPK